MKMKKNWKRFFTLDRHHAEGFTLVELIVVIAILAILAGVAVPAYSGYITKANRVADEQLLDTMTNAFHSACIEENISILDLENTKVVLNDDNTFFGFDFSGAEVDPSVTLSVTPSISDDPFTTTFMVYFGTDSQKQAFTVITNIIFRNGSFVDASTLGGMFQDIINELVANGTISQETLDAIKNSTFGEDIGSALLLGKVDSVSSIASGLLGDSGYGAIDKVIYGNDPENPSNEYFNNLATSLGKTPKELRKIYNDLSDEEKNNFLANSLVLTAAGKTQNMDTSFLGTAGFADKLQSDLDDPAKSTDAMAQAALAYGMYTAYANSSYGNDELKKNVNDLETSGGFGGLTSMLGDLEDENFKNYLASDEGKADLDAYKAAMDVINKTTSQSSDAAVDVLINGFTDQDLEDTLGNIMSN